MTVSYFEEIRFQAKDEINVPIALSAFRDKERFQLAEDEINVPIALSAFRDKSVSKFPAPLFIVRPTL